MISCLIIGHLWAVFGSPLEFATQSNGVPSPSIGRAFYPLRGYSEAMYLNHGYAFFAPDPGPSNLFRAVITMPDGTEKTEMYPNLESQWPRLIYHRHFMLSEFLTSAYEAPVPPAPNPETQEPGLLLAPQERSGWRKRRRRYEAIRNSIVQHLQTKYPDAKIEIQRIQHAIPSLDDSLAGMKVNDRRLFFIMPESLDEEPRPLYPDAFDGPDNPQAPSGTDPTSEESSESEGTLPPQVETSR